MMAAMASASSRPYVLVYVKARAAGINPNGRLSLSLDDQQVRLCQGNRYMALELPRLGE